MQLHAQMWVSPSRLSWVLPHPAGPSYSHNAQTAVCVSVCVSVVHPPPVVLYEPNHLVTVIETVARSENNERPTDPPTERTSTFHSSM